MDSLGRSNILSAIGNTPIVRLSRIARGIGSEIYAKLEFTNPGGSIKDRPGVYMCRKAAESGALQAGQTIVEGTAGNTGIGVCLYAAVHGHPCVFVMSDKQSLEKIRKLKAYGAKVVICPANVDHGDPRSYFSVAARLSEELPAFHVNQYDNPHNAECHYRETGPEILAQTGGDFEAFVAGVGTGGTISGTGRFLKEQNPRLRVIGVDSNGSVLAHFHATGELKTPSPYLIEGIGERFLPRNVDFSVINAFEVVGDEAAFQMARRLLSEEGVYTGGSGGAAVLGAVRYAERLSSPQRILAILPDSGDRYATRIYDDAWMASQGFTAESECSAANGLEDRIHRIVEHRGALA